VGGLSGEEKSKPSSRTKRLREMGGKKRAAAERARQKKRIEMKFAKPEWVKTGIPGFDLLFGKGIPKGKNILIAGGPGTGKTVFCLQTLYRAARKGHDCFYITFEEPSMNLVQQMRKFNWDIRRIYVRGEGMNPGQSILVEVGEKRGRIVITRQDPFKIAKSVEALLANVSNHLRVKMSRIPELIPETIDPYMIALDSISALESAFIGSPKSYRIYIEQLFRLLGKKEATTFLTIKTEDPLVRLSKTGVEDFLADGVFVMYYIKARDTRIRALEVLKLRGAEHEGKVVPFVIQRHGIEVFPGERIYEVEW
jgi:circadian clock protein KaiC